MTEVWGFAVPAEACGAVEHRAAFILRSAANLPPAMGLRHSFQRDPDWHCGGVALVSVIWTAPRPCPAMPPFDGVNIHG